MTTKPNCRKCGDTGLRQIATSLLQCDCPMGAHFAGAPGQPAPRAPVADATTLISERELDELKRELGNLERELVEQKKSNALEREANRALEVQLAECRDVIDAGDKTVTALRERAELAETQRDNLQRELEAARAAAAETVRTDSAKRSK